MAEETVAELTKKLEDAKRREGKNDTFKRRDPMQSVEDMYRATEELRNRLWTDEVSVEKSNALNRLDNTMLRQIEVNIKLERRDAERKQKKPAKLFGPAPVEGEQK